MTEPIRVIPCLDVSGGRVVKGVNFKNLRDAGDPVELAARYEEQGADELTFLDVTATVDERETTYELVRKTVEQLRIPLTVGGGVRSVEDAQRLLDLGATRVGVNSAAIARPELITEITERFGAEALVLSLDVQRSSAKPSGFAVTTHGGQRESDLDALEWASRAVDLGARTLLVNSMDADGTRDGFDLELTRMICDRVSVKAAVIASGGAGRPEDFPPAVEAGATAVLAASVFHDGTMTVSDVKRAIAAAGHPVRGSEA